MELYLIRHADALALGERGITDDAERPLSEQGENQCRTLAHGLLQKGITLDGLVASPLVRAKQTADLLVAQLVGDSDGSGSFRRADTGRPAGKAGPVSAQAGRAQSWASSAICRTCRTLPRG